MPTPEICFVYFHVTGMWKPAQIRDDFADMVDSGGDWIMTAFLEGGPGDALKLKVDLAHEAGLKVMAAPGRVAGLFAAGPRPCSMFAVMNPDAICRTKDGRPVIGTSGAVCCVNNPRFQEWFYPHLVGILTDSGADAVAFDEPKECHAPCWCECCTSLVDDPTNEALTALKEASMAAMMGRVCSLLKGRRPHAHGIAMLMPNATDSFIDHMLEQEALDYLGNDGPMCLQGPAGTDGKPAGHQKTPLTESSPRFAAKTREAGKKAFGLTETFGVYSWAHDQLRENVRLLPDLGLDMYGFNYFGHDVEDPNGVMEIVRAAVRHVKP